MKLRRSLTYIALFVFGVVILSIQSSCTKTVTKVVTDTVKHAWQPVSMFNLYGTLYLSSASLGDSVFVVAGSNMYITVPVNGNGLIDFMGVPLIGTSLNSPAYGVPLITNKLCTYSTSSSLYLQSVPNYNQNSNFSYTPTFTPGFYKIFPQTSGYPSNSYPSAAYPVVHNKYLLVPVETNPNDQWKKVRFDLLSFDSTKILTRFAVGDAPTVKNIFLSSAPGTLGFASSEYFCASFYNKFFVYYGSQFFRVDTTGNVKAFGYLPSPLPNGFGVHNMFVMGNTLFVKSGGILFASVDQGETWSVFNDFSNAGISYAVFINVGNKLYASFSSQNTQIFKVTFSGRNLNFSELNNDGLENHILTSITQCGRYDFITTTSGVFYRDTAVFDQLKTPIR